MEIQMMNRDQINSVCNVMSTYITNVYNSTIENIKKSEDFLKKVEELKSSEWYLTELTSINKDYNTELKIINIQKELTDLGDYKIEDLDFILSSHDEESANFNRLNSIKNLDIRTEDKAIEELGYIHGIYSVECALMDEIKARLSLLQISDYDTIISSMRKLVDDHIENFMIINDYTI